MEVVAATVLLVLLSSFVGQHYRRTYSLILDFDDCDTSAVIVVVVRFVDGHNRRSCWRCVAVLVSVAVHAGHRDSWTKQTDKLQLQQQLDDLRNPIVVVDFAAG